MKLILMLLAVKPLAMPMEGISERFGWGFRPRVIHVAIRFHLICIMRLGHQKSTKTGHIGPRREPWKAS